MSKYFIKKKFEKEVLKLLDVVDSFIMFDHSILSKNDY